MAIWVTIRDTFFISLVELWNDDSQLSFICNPNHTLMIASFFKTFIRRKGSQNGGNHLLLSSTLLIYLYERPQVNEPTFPATVLYIFLLWHMMKKVEKLSRMRSSRFRSSTRSSVFFFTWESLCPVFNGPRSLISSIFYKSSRWKMLLMLFLKHEKRKQDFTTF